MLLMDVYIGLCASVFKIVKCKVEKCGILQTRLALINEFHTCCYDDAF